MRKSCIVVDLTHQITPFDIQEAAYRLYQSVPYWPKGTVFVSIVDPGVGTPRRSVVAESANGYYFVTPDNGTLTMVQHHFGITNVREIDEQRHRLPGSDASHTFHGRDVYAYTAAKLASGQITFEQVGKISTEPLLVHALPSACIQDNKIIGCVVALDPQYGNVWTNIDQATLTHFGLLEKGHYEVSLYENQTKIFKGSLPFLRTFGHTTKGQNLLYVNSLLCLAIGQNQGNFATIYGVKKNCTIVIEK